MKKLNLVSVDAPDTSLDILVSQLEEQVSHSSLDHKSYDALRKDVQRKRANLIAVLSQLGTLPVVNQQEVIDQSFAKSN